MFSTLMNKIRPFAGQCLPPIVVTQIKRRLLASPYRLDQVLKSNPDIPAGVKVLLEAREHLDFKAGRNRAIHGIAASPRWDVLLDRMRDDIALFKTAGEAIIFAQTRIDFDHRAPVSACGHFYQLHADTLKNEFPHFAKLVDEISDSPHSRPETLLRVQDRLVSNVLFWHLNFLLQCLTWVPKPEQICEIGGGYGALARLWLLNPVARPRTYVIVDFPESLFFAEVFLKSNFEGLKLHYMTGAEPLTPEFMKQHRIVLCPIQHVEALSPLAFDLVINTGSLAEMTEEWVDFWMGWLRRQQCRYFYSMNYFAQPLNYMAEASNSCSPRLTPEWTVRLLKANPAFVMQQTVRSFAEMFAEKTGASVPAAALAARYALARERVLTNQALLECMDIVRLNPGEEVVWDLVQRIAEQRTVPKEAYFLADNLTRTAGERFRAEHGAELAAIFKRFQRIRASGRENTYSP